MYTPGGGGVWGGSNLLYTSIAYYLQKGGGWVQIACEIAYVLNGRSLAKENSAIDFYPTFLTVVQSI